MKKNSFFENLKHPFLIAEISANHNGSLKNCLDLIKSATKNTKKTIFIRFLGNFNLERLYLTKFLIKNS